MQKFPEYFEAQSYEQRPIPPKEAIFTKSESTYTTYKYLEKSSEYTLPLEISELIKDSFSYGIIPEIKTIWISHTKLFLYNYFTCVLKEIKFNSMVKNILFFQPKRHFFTEKVKHALIIITERHIIFYGIDTDTNELIETGILVHNPCIINAVSTYEGNIFLGGEDGDLYSLIYSNNNFLSLRTAFLKNIDSSIVKRLLPSFFKNKNEPISKISNSDKWILVLSKKEIRIYAKKGSEIKKEAHFMPSVSDSAFLDLKIVEESSNSVFYYLITQNGRRFYFSNGTFLFERRPPLEENDILPLKHLGNKNGLILYKKTGLAYFINLNEDSLKNFTLNKIIENYEVIKTEFDEIFLTNDKLIILKGRNATFYDINDAESLLEHCRPEEIYTIMKAYGERETVALFYSLISKEKDVSRIEHLIPRNDLIRKQGFFTFLFRMVNEIWKKEINSLFFFGGRKNL